jgi:hypothetical protein
MLNFRLAKTLFYRLNLFSSHRPVNSPDTYL